MTMAAANSSVKRVTLVTGASRGIGRAICERLAAQDHLIVGIARSAGDSAFPGELVAADLGDEQATRRALADSSPAIR